jgi:H+/gluconate symporter-like permease
MPPVRRSIAAVATTTVVVLTTWLAAGPAAAQKPLPPRYDELQASKPWTYLMGWALFAGAMLLIGLAVLGYLIKGREFRANQRRGGSK